MVNIVVAWLVRRPTRTEERKSVNLHSVNQLLNITVSSSSFQRLCIKPHKDKVLYLTGKKPSSQQRKQDLYQRLPTLLHSLQLIYLTNFSSELRTENGDAMSAKRASVDIPCSVNATFARNRERSPHLLIIQESTEKANSSVTYSPSEQNVWKKKREP